MTYIEDLISILASSAASSIEAWDFKVVHSFDSTITNSIGLTEKQRGLAIRIITRNSSILQKYVLDNVSELLRDPQFRLPIRKSMEIRSVNIIDVDGSRAIEVKFPYDESIIEKIKKHRIFVKNYGLVSWDKTRMAWVFLLNEENIDFILNDLMIENCEYDEEFQDYIAQTHNIINNIENIVPTVTLVNETIKIRNIQVGMPQLTETEIIPALFEARKFGVTYWDDNIDEYLRSQDADKVTTEFLTTAGPFHIEENGENCLKNVIKYMGPSLFIIPGGSEFAKIKEIYTLVCGMNIDTSKVSVLFRLPAETGQNFNDFVKNQGLNNPIDANTKIVCICSKLPKTILKSKIEFNSVVNFGFNNPHYSLKEFVKNHQNLVVYRSKPSKALSMFEVE
jgi:hypothetical protein